MAQPTNSFSGDVSMASPNAASLGKYTDIPVSYFTGVPQIGVPIYTVEEGPLKLPISLSYHASGVKPNEPSSWVGTNWSLNAGGLITRTVIGKPDESQFGYINQGHLLTGDQSTAPDIQSDTEPDIFSFNFNGYSGRFFIVTENAIKTIKFIEKTDMKATVMVNTTVNKIEGFVFITPDGVKYTFGYNQVVYAREVTSLPGFDAESAWHLLKMESYDAKFSISFEYDEERTSYPELSSCEIVSIIQSSYLLISLYN